MPQSTRKKSISSVLNSGKFELLSKNKVSLGNDEELSFDYKPLKIGDLASPIEFTQDKLRINTDLEFDGNLLSHAVKTDNLYLEFETGSSGYHRFKTKANSTSLDLWVLSGTSYWIYEGAKTQYIGLTSAYTWAQANLSADPVVAQNMAVLQAASDNETSFRVLRTGDSGDFAKFAIKDAGECILTATAAGSDGFFSIKNEVATLLTITEAALTVTGDIILDDGGSIKEAGGTAAITIDASGEVTKIGQDTPSDGQVLKWHASTSKVVWASESGGTTGISDGNLLECNANVADNDFLRIDGTEVEGRSATQVLSDIGAQASGNYITGTGSLSGTDLTNIGNLSGTNTGDQTLPTNYVRDDEDDTMNGALTVNGNILAKTVVYFDAETATTIGDGATGAINWTHNQKQKVTITGTGITCNFTNPPGPCNLLLKVVQGDGSDVIGTWDSDIKWAGGGTAPTLSTGNGEIDILSFYFDGTNYFGVASLDFQ